MKQYKLKLLGLAIVLLAALPTVTKASSAVRLADDTILFTIDFVVNDQLFTNQVPIMAQHGITYQDRVDILGYTIEGTSDTELKLETANALVLSNAKVEDNKYVVEKGVPTKFTLFILATFNEPLTENDYRARITKLPHFLDGRRTTVHQDQLDELAVPTLEVTD